MAQVMRLQSCGHQCASRPLQLPVVACTKVMLGLGSAFWRVQASLLALSADRS